MQIIHQQKTYLLQLLLQIKRFKLLIIFVICLGCLLSQTYNISGKVLDSKTLLPIYGVNIFFVNTNIGTITDKEGYFHLTWNKQVEDSIKLNVKMIGYKQRIIPLDTTKSTICNTCLFPQINLGEIFLTVKSIELESINIHAHQVNQISDIILSGQQLNENLRTNLATTLSSQPNIGVSSFGVVTSKPVLRGFSGDRFLLTKNGIKMGDLSQTSIDHAITLEVSDVNKIEIIRGPKALIYGSNAIGGVINASITGNPRVKFDSFHSKINVGGESFNSSYYGSIVLYIPIKNNQINLSINNRNTGNQTSPIGKLKNTQSQTTNYKIGFTKYGQKSFINCIVENYNMNYGIPPSKEGHINGVDIKLVKNTFQLNYHIDISLYDFDQLDIIYNFIDYSHGEYESNFDFRAVGLLKNTYNTKIELKSDHSIIGTDINYKQFSSEGFYWTPRTNEISISFYGFLKKQLDAYDLLTSFRLGSLVIQPQKPFMNFSNLNSDEVIDRQFTYFSSSIGIKRNFDSIEISSWLMNTMRAPILEELYSDGPHLGTYSYEIGTPSLDLEKIYGFESSISYNTLPLSMSFTTFYNYSPYYYQMNKMGYCYEEFVNGQDHPCSGADFIEWGSGASGWLYKYQSEGVESIIRGLEFNLGYNYKDFRLIYDFSLVRGDNLTQKLPLSYMNPDKHILILNFEKKNMNYKFKTSKIHAQNRLGEFETSTASSILVDFIFSYNYKKQDISIQFNNIYNNKYRNHLSRTKDIMLEPGRSILINYKIIL